MDSCGLPLALLSRRGLLRSRLVYLSIGGRSYAEQLDDLVRGLAGATAWPRAGR